MDRDGTQEGSDLELLHVLTNQVNIPVIASGGAGKLQDFADALSIGGADAILAASLFHTRAMTIAQLKQFLREKGVPVR
jgi:cyclase